MEGKGAMIMMLAHVLISGIDPPVGLWSPGVKVMLAGLLG